MEGQLVQQRIVLQLAGFSVGSGVGMVMEGKGSASWNTNLTSQKQQD
jgi:hypothetical protein